mmetsp:Transcript_37168/g.77206  ORF Transcript_37168/g.77206 Transcript_37168/m.77206 type:complete len:503 (-) Transcript_37168:1761-3269(-)
MSAVASKRARSGLKGTKIGRVRRKVRGQRCKKWFNFRHVLVAVGAFVLLASLTTRLEEDDKMIEDLRKAEIHPSRLGKLNKSATDGQIRQDSVARRKIADNLTGTVSSQTKHQQWKSQTQLNHVGVAQNNSAPESNQCAGSLRRPKYNTVTLSDLQSKVLAVGAPKGGATITTQLMLKHWNLIDVALEYSTWVHDYRNEMYKQKQFRPQKCKDVCGLAQWTCFKIIRSPFDRAVSSFIHTSRTEIFRKFPELLKLLKEKVSQQQSESGGVAAPSIPKRQWGTLVTFELFIKALRMRQLKFRRSPLDDHFLPQADDDCLIESSGARFVDHIPLEALEASLVVFNETRGIFLNSTDLTSHHYVVKGSTSMDRTNAISGKDRPEKASNQLQHPSVDVSSIPSARLFVKGSNGSAKLGKSASPSAKLAFPYESFFVNTAVNAEFCALYCQDILLYANMCNQDMFQLPAESDKPYHVNNEIEVIQGICGRERKRIQLICGDSYDFFQ